MKNLRQRLRAALQESESGQSMVEYALVTALIAVVAILAVQTLGDGIVSVFENIADAISDI